MDDPFVNNFLKNYKPKNMEAELEPYFQCPKLKNYKYLKNKVDLITGETYIRYIDIDKAFSDKSYSDHIKSGGILLKGGIIEDRKFAGTDDNKNWTHLMLKYEPIKKTINKGKTIIKKFDPLTYVINISKCYIFYKKYQQINYNKYQVEKLKNKN